jgi:four helix bundle protein
MSMAARRFEDLACWPPSMELHSRVAALVARRSVQDNRRFRDQLIAAATSGAANIAEGFARRNDGEFVNFLRYALGSIAETVTRLLEGRDLGYFDDHDLKEPRHLARRATAATKGLLRYLKRGRDDPRGRDTD